jgi:polysaccharide biosynthesis/export protein
VLLDYFIAAVSAPVRARVARWFTLIRAAVGFFLLALLCGCGFLPSAGPSRAGVMLPSDQFELIGVNGPVARQLASVPSSTLHAKFGDYRKAPDLRIGVGDSVTVTVWEAGSSGLFASANASEPVGNTNTHATAMPEQMVAEDGTIDIPYVGHIKIAERTSREVGETIVRSLKGRSLEPQALVQITKNNSNTVTVTGDVVGGGNIPLSPKGTRLLEVIAASGGLRAAAYDTHVTLSRNGVTATVPFVHITEDPTENVYVHPGDVITVLKRPQVFTAFGATGRNAQIPFGRDQLTLSMALAMSGGLLDSRADPSAVFLVRREPAQFVQSLNPESRLASLEPVVPVAYRIDLSDANGYVYAQSIPMRDGDLLFVSDAPAAELQKVFSIIAPATSEAAGATVLTTGTP